MRNITLVAVVALAALLGIISCSKEDAVSSETDENSTARVSENSAVGDPPPYHDLNIIGVPAGKEGFMPSLPQTNIYGTFTATNTIFVPLEGRPKVMLIRSDPFPYSVSDNYALDGSARIELPSSDINNDGTSSYSIWAKQINVAGNKGIFTCNGPNSSNSDFYYEICSAGELTFRTGGNPRLTNVSGQLLSIALPRGRDINTDNDPEFEIPAGRYPAFESRLIDYYWQPYGTEGLKLLQLRFVGK